MRDPNVPEHGWRRGVLASASAIGLPEPAVEPRHVPDFADYLEGEGVGCLRCGERVYPRQLAGETCDPHPVVLAGTDTRRLIRRADGVLALQAVYAGRWRTTMYPSAVTDALLRWVSGGEVA